MQGRHKQQTKGESSRPFPICAGLVRRKNADADLSRMARGLKELSWEDHMMGANMLLARQEASFKQQHASP